VSERVRAGRITIDWVDATETDAADVGYNFGWRIKPEPPIDDDRLATLLREIAETLEPPLEARKSALIVARSPDREAKINFRLSA
jgi:hypothetical protein